MIWDLWHGDCTAQWDFNHHQVFKSRGEMEDSTVGKVLVIMFVPTGLGWLSGKVLFYPLFLLASCVLIVTYSLNMEDTSVLVKVCIFHDRLRKPLSVLV